MIDIQRTKEIHLAICAHFTRKYDFFRYNGKLGGRTELKPGEFAYRQLAARLLSEEKVIEFCVANVVNQYITDNKISSYVGSVARKENFLIWKDWQKRTNSLLYTLKSELKEDLPDLIRIDGCHPPIFNRYLQKKISAETICCLHIAIPKLLPYWEQKTEDPVLLPGFCHFINRYSPFLKVDKAKLKQTLGDL
jgi:hypothetical protein